MSPKRTKIDKNWHKNQTNQTEIGPKWTKKEENWPKNRLILSNDIPKLGQILPKVSEQNGLKRPNEKKKA